MAFYGQGSASYVGLAQQTAYGGSLVSAGLATYPNLGGDVLASVAGLASRQSIANAIVKGSQTYKTVDQSNVGVSFEFVTDDTQHNPLMTAAFGQRYYVAATSGVAGSNTFTVTQPAYDAGTDLTTALLTYYNHTLSWHEFVTDGSANQSKWSCQDVIITSMSLRGVANGTINCTVGGIGRKFLVSPSTVGYTDSAGTLLNWGHAADLLLVGTASPPTTKMVCREWTFTLNQPHTIAPALGAEAGAEMRPPVRSGQATATLAVTMDFEDHAGYDAADILAAFYAGTAHNLILTYNGGAGKTLAIACSGTSAGAKINEPKTNWGSTGPVTFSCVFGMNPETITDLSLTLGIVPLP